MTLTEGQGELLGSVPSKHDDMGPLCERELTQPERATVTKKNRLAATALNTEVESIGENPVVVKKVSDRDIAYKWFCGNSAYS